MRHHCSNCSSEFFDDAPSENPPARVFCVFCGVPLSAAGEEGSRSVPFSPDFPRAEAFALGVIGGAGSEFPDTLKQFRAHGARPKHGSDSLSPVQTGSERPSAEPPSEPWRLKRFWTSLAIGFGVGAVVAAILAQRGAVPSPAATNPPASRAPAAKPASVLSGCAVASAAPPVVSLLPSATGKPAITPVLERRFWLERAHAAQRQYRWQDADRFYRRVLSLAPRDSEALTGVGELELLRGAPGSAAARFREVLASNANYVPALVALADLRWQAGEAEAARDEYRNIVDHYSDELYPPYVKQRLEAESCVPQCR